MHIGWPGHVGPANRLTAVLARQGHDVVAWAPEHHREAVEAAGAELRPMGWEGQPAARPEPPPDRGLSGLAAMLAQATVAQTGPLVDALLAEDVELVVHDAIAPWGRVAGDFLGLPRICSFPGHPPVWPLGIGPVPPSHAAVLGECRDEVRRRWGMELGDAAAVLISPGDQTTVYSVPEVIGRPMPQPTWRSVGPLMGPAPEPDSEPALAGLDGAPLVYVALGTSFNYRFDVFRTVLDALAGEEVVVLLSTGGLETGRLGPVPANARVAERVLSRAVLARTAVHVTHAGASSVHESLLAGVPMVCVPQGADNPRWAERVAAVGAGMVVTEPTEEGLRDAILGVQGDEAMRQSTGELARRLAAFDGEAVVADAVARLLR